MEISAEIRIFGSSMQVLRFLSRVAFICNICFLLASFIQWMPYEIKGEPVASIIVMGYLMALVVNVAVNASVILLFLIGKLRSTGIPVWLGIANFLFFVLQIILF